jgi:hypothetical protein
MPFAFLMTDFLKRLETGDHEALEFRDRVMRLFRVATLQERPWAQRTNGPTTPGNRARIDQSHWTGPSRIFR